MTKGLNVSTNDYVLINAEIEQAPLVRLMTQHAYQLGAKHVKVNWTDIAIRISLRSANPNALKDIAPEKLAAASKAASLAFSEQRIASQANVMSWLVCAAAGQEWAALVFPELESSEAQVDALWDQIFKTTRV